MNWRERYEDMIDHWSDAHNLSSCESKDRKKIHNMQGSRLTFPLASPVASDSFDSLAKTNISPARYSFINLNSSTIDKLGEWCLERRVRPRIKPSRTHRVSMTTL